MTVRSACLHGPLEAEPVRAQGVCDPPGGRGDFDAIEEVTGQPMRWLAPPAGLSD